MSRAPWLGRPAGRHAAGARGRARPGADAGASAGAGAAPADAVPGAAVPGNAAPGSVAPAMGAPPWAAEPAPGAWLLGAPTMAETPAMTGTPTIAGAPLVSPVTDAARAAVAESAAMIPTYVPAGAAPLVTIDALGRKCPIPIIMVADQIRDIPVGSVIAVLADDPAAYPDIPAWCGLKSHDCVFRVDLTSGWAFGIRRRY